MKPSFRLIISTIICLLSHPNKVESNWVLFYLTHQALESLGLTRSAGSNSDVIQYFIVQSKGQAQEKGLERMTRNEVKGFMLALLDQSQQTNETSEVGK